jgi:preprotein translocase subunit SecY
MLITVGVLLDTMRQAETYLLQRHYDGFLKKGRIRGRNAGRSTSSLVESGELKNLRWLLVVVAAWIIIGVAAWLVNNVL